MSATKSPNSFRQLHERGYDFHVFISWPNTIQEQGRKLVEQLYADLMDRFKNYAYGEVFLDRQRLAVGYKWNQEIRKSLCRSGVTIVILVPAYFESEYCRIEWNVTENLQGDRLPKQCSATCFVPILLQEDTPLPDEVKDIVYDCSFSKILSYSKEPKRHPKWGEQIDALTKHIAHLLKLMCSTDVCTPNWQANEAKAMKLGPKDFCWSDANGAIATPAPITNQPPTTLRRELPSAVASESLL